MKMTVGTGAAVPIPFDSDSRVLLQNLGPGDIYMDTKSTVTADATATGGVKLVVGAIYETQVTGSAFGSIYVTASLASTDLRYMEV